jgi:hypothetical protein
VRVHAWTLSSDPAEEHADAMSGSLEGEGP